MKHTKEEIIGALKVIKEECASHTMCHICPLWSHEVSRACMVSNQHPEDWEINETEPETWRAFK